MSLPSQQCHYKVSVVCIKIYYNYVIYCMASFMGCQKPLDCHLKIDPVWIVSMCVCVCVNPGPVLTSFSAKNHAV